VTLRGGRLSSLERPLVPLVGALFALGLGATIALIDSWLLSLLIVVGATGVILLARSNARIWLSVLACVVAFDGLLKLTFWPSIWPQLLTPLALCCVYLRTLFVRPNLSWLPFAVVPLLGLGLLTILSLLSMIANGQQSSLAGLVGIYTWVAFAPLAWVGATLLSERKEIERAAFYVLLIAAPISAVAAIQYLLGAAWYASLGPGFAQATIGVAGFSGEGVFRVNGTFSSPGHLAGFMIPVTFLSIVATTAGERRSTRWAGGVGLVATTVTLFANNQRSWAVIVLVGIPILYLLTRSSVRPARWLSLGVIAFGGLLVGAAVAGPGLVDRVLTVAVDPVQVILGSTLGDFGVLKLASIIDAGTLLGNGPGTATIGARYFGAIWELTENYFANAYYELGPFGLVALASAVFTVPTITLRAWKAEPDQFVRTFLAATLVYQAAIIVISISYSPLAYPPSALFFWIGGGIAASRLADASQSTRTPEAAEQTIRVADLSWSARNGRLVGSGTRPSTATGR
jgi:hypothetical protein